MSIDPSIPLSVRPYESKSPMQSLGQMMQLRAFQQQNDERALVAEKNRRALQAQEAFQRAVQARQGDYDAAVKDLELGGFADEAMSVRTALFEQRKKLADELKVSLDNRSAALTQGSRLLQGVTTPEQYAAVLPEIRSLVGPSLAQQIPEAFDPAFVAQAVQWGMSAADVSGRLSAAASSLNAAIAAKKEGRDADKEFTASLAGWLPHVGSQEEWTQALQTAQQAGAPPSVLAKFGEQFSPEAAQKAAVLGMTPEQIAQADVQRVQLSAQARRDAETRRHNLVSEANANKPPAGSYQWAVGKDGKPRLMTPEEIRAEGAEKPLSATEAMDARKFSKAAPVFSAISELSEKINTQQGVVAKMYGGAKKAAAKANLDDDVAEYESLVMGFTPLVARALGHTGVLTEQDVASVRMLFPKPGDSKSLRDRKIARITSIAAELGGGSPAPVSGEGALTEGAQQPIPGIPGGVAEFRGGKWIRIK